MQQTYLEVTYRRGRPFAAYYYLPRRSGQRSYRTEEVAPGLLVDYARGGKAIGVEISAPAAVTLSALNRVLKQLGHTPLKRDEFAPLRAA